jgi:hypothetical protein
MLGSPSQHPVGAVCGSAARTDPAGGDGQPSSLPGPTQAHQMGVVNLLLTGALAGEARARIVDLN